MSGWRKVYDLAEDEGYVAHLQYGAGLSEYPFGLRPDPALVGSDEWWQALGTAALPIVTVEGEISDIDRDGHGATPAFELAQDDGRTSRWLSTHDPRWEVGRRARIEYVVQWARRGDEMPVVVRLWLGEKDSSRA